MYVALADLYRKRRRFAEAEDLCRKAIALDATRPEAYLSLARLYNAQHSSDKALRFSARRCRRQGDPASEYYQKLQADLLVEQGAAYQAKRKAPQAIEAYAHALDLDPDRGAVHRQLAELYLRAGTRPEPSSTPRPRRNWAHPRSATRAQIFK